MNAEDYFNNGKVYVWKETFAVIKSKKINRHAFANIVDKNEITVVIDESKVVKNEVMSIEKGWKLLTFDMMLPFELVGFIANISRALADKKIPIFLVSAYSTDHILIKEKDLPKAKKCLQKLGFIINEK